MKVGDKYPTWFSGQPDRMSLVLAIAPYYSRVYPGMFTHVLTLTAPRTRAGSLEMCVNL